MTLTFFALMGLIAVIIGAWWALVDAVASGNWYLRGTTPSETPQQIHERERLMRIAATYQPPSVALFSQPAPKGFTRKLRAVDGRTPTTPHTPEA